MKDCHLHFLPGYGPVEPPDSFVRKAAAAGITGGTVMSMPPESFKGPAAPWQERLEQVLDYCAQTPGFHPFFWFDPTEKDAFEQISCAAEKGVWGFKVISNHFYPEECLKEFTAVAETGLPIHFHSGILYDTRVSGKFLRPMNFECLMTVPELRFALAHLGNPWVDEYVMLYAKFNAARIIDPEKCTHRMFIDLTPGVSRFRRGDALRMLLLPGHSDPSEDIIWGSDSLLHNYDTKRAETFMDFDRTQINEIIKESHAAPGLYLQLPDDLWEKISGKNLAAFYGRNI
jgi:predicted TIM-barrel fold metal-dependent hydrolase